MNELRNLSKAEAIALAKQITGITVRSKREAIRKIAKHQRALETFKLKGQITAGRSAA